MHARLKGGAIKEDGSAHAERLPGVIQRAAAVSSLDDQQGVQDQRHDPVPGRKVDGLYEDAGLKLRDRQVVLYDGPLEAGVLRVVSHVKRISQHDHRHSVGPDRGPVGCRVDALYRRIKVRDHSSEKLGIGHLI